MFEKKKTSICQRGEQIHNKDFDRNAMITFKRFLSMVL